MTMIDVSPFLRAHNNQPALTDNLSVAELVTCISSDVQWKRLRLGGTTIAEHAEMSEQLHLDGRNQY